MRTRAACQFAFAAAALLACSAEARIFMPREGRFLSPDRAGMVEGPNLYQYVQSQPTMRRDPTGQFSDIDPELPQFNEALIAAVAIDVHIVLWRLSSDAPCFISNWPEVKARLVETVETKEVTIARAASVWQPRLGGPQAFAAFTDATLSGNATTYLTPAAGHTSIRSDRGTEWEAALVPTPSGMRTVRTWVGLLAHELTHAAGYYSRGPGISAATAFNNETLATQVGVYIEDQIGGAPLDTTPYEAGPRPQ